MVATVDRFHNTEKRTSLTVAFAASLPEALFSVETLEMWYHGMEEVVKQKCKRVVGGGLGGNRALRLKWWEESERLGWTTPSGSRLPDRKRCLELDVFDCGCKLPCYLQPGGTALGATKWLRAAEASNGAEAVVGADITSDWQTAAVAVEITKARLSQAPSLRRSGRSAQMKHCGDLERPPPSSLSSTLGPASLAGGGQPGMDL
ncbi:hypothetical protein DFH27DRAFT_611879 [Peziza echinospora]|nr:hypothetical protein DFH27DRAFT_611879 [Peziza echinospora]